MDETPRDPAEPPPPGALPAWLVVPHPRRCDPGRADFARILALHGEAMANGRESYIDPATGYSVWTAQYLWDAGFCCDAGCRHCPFVAR